MFDTCITYCLSVLTFTCFENSDKDLQAEHLDFELGIYNGSLHQEGIK